METDHDPADDSSTRHTGDESDRSADADGERNGGVLDRRRLMQAIGAGAAVTLGANAVAAPATARQDDVPIERSGEVIHPVFGFSALSMDVDPPVEPDHVVEARIQPHEDREIPEFYFEPTGLYVEPGDTVQFSLVSPHHSVTAYHPGIGTQQRVPDDVPPLSSPVLPVNAYWLYTFEQPGVYDLHCGPHEIFGHVIRIVAGEVSGPGAEPVPEPEPIPGPDADPDRDRDRDGMPGDGERHGNGPPDDDMPHGNGPAEDDRPDDGPDDGPEGQDRPPEDEPELRPPVGAGLTVLGDPAIDPDRILEEGQVSWEEIDDASKEIML